MIPWQDLHAVLSRLASVGELTPESCAGALGCEFDEVTPGRYRGRGLPEPFAAADLRMAGSSPLLVLDTDPAADRSALAAGVASLGRAERVDMVSPPVFDPGRPHARPRWDRKYSIRHTLAGRPVWFGIEQYGGEDRLVSVSIGSALG